MVSGHALESAIAAVEALVSGKRVDIAAFAKADADGAVALFGERLRERDAAELRTVLFGDVPDIRPQQSEDRLEDTRLSAMLIAAALAGGWDRARTLAGMLAAHRASQQAAE